MAQARRRHRISLGRNRADAVGGSPQNHIITLGILQNEASKVMS